MINTINLNDEKFILEIIRKKNIKHMYLKIIEPYKIQIRTNPWVDENYLENFIHKKRDWIIKNHKNICPKPLDENKMLYLGKIYFKNDLIGDKDIEKFYKEESKEFIIPIVEKYSNIMGLYPQKVKFRKNRTRWGSCSSKNNINLNTELIKYDEKFIEYVVVHELAHIKYKNHKKEFWNLVESYMPDFKLRKKMRLLN